MRYLILIFVLVLGAIVLAPTISAIGLDPMPGDFTLKQGDWHFFVPVLYSLCASLGLGLFYYFMKR